MRKNDFIGREALIEEQRSGPARKRVIFRVDANGVDALANEPVFCDGETVGWVTSGGFCHHLDASIALGYVPSELAERTGRLPDRDPGRDARCGGPPRAAIRSRRRQDARLTATEARCA